jgi:protein-tyrosine phosphatase
MVDYTRIASKLYMGSAPPTGTSLHRAGFDVVVLCAEEYQPARYEFPGIEVMRVPLEDDDSRPVELSDWSAILLTARRIQRRVQAGRRVLVTCQMGLNRSGIVTATAYHLLTGVSGTEAARVVRSLRIVGEQRALFNRAFVRALCHRLPARHWAA